MLIRGRQARADIGRRRRDNSRPMTKRTRPQVLALLKEYRDHRRYVQAALPRARRRLRVRSPPQCPRVDPPGRGDDDVFLDLVPERGIVAGQRWKEALRVRSRRGPG
jgi:hypothetical protein